MKITETAIEMLWDRIHTGNPTEDDYQVYSDGNWDRFEGQQEVIASVREAIEESAKIREELDWTNLVSNASYSCLSEDDLVEEIARQSWTEYWYGMVDTGWMDEHFPQTEYEVKDANTGCVISRTDDILVALKARERFESASGMNEAIIRDASGNEVDPDYGWEIFVGDVFENSGNPTMNEPYRTADEAQETLDHWNAEGVEIPAGMTAQVLQHLWNAECGVYN